MIVPANPLQMPDLDYAAIDAAIFRGIHEAVLNRARLGLSVSVWRDGKVVILSPDEVLAEEVAERANGSTNAARGA
ncbi:MAG: hypothetical protein IAF94_01870 [Pirellulaceae bacterium]|nr:hypothetical protein [Pirellulaceae bacterium]